VEVIEIPYVKGGTDLLPALLGGHLDAAYVEYVSAKSLIESGKLDSCLTFSNQRYTVTPDIPCATELGYETIVTYNPVYVHKDTPEILRKLLWKP